MKTPLAAIGFFALAGWATHGQIGTASVPEDLSYSIAERGPHHRVWEAVEWETTPFGKPVARTRRYVELETGMHAWRGGQFVEASAEIALTAEGAAATNAAHQVFFGANVNTAPALLLITPEGKQLRSRVLGLSYFDAATGRAVLLAETKDSIGALFGANRVVYTNAFDDVDAEVEYLVTKAGLQQNVVLRGQLPDPSQFDLNPASTRLQVLTEFFDPPVPGKRIVTTRAELADEILDFGEMKISGPGRAFAIGADGEASQPVRVYKQWTVLGDEGRTFLVEEVPFNQVDAQLQALERKRQGASLRQDRRGQGETVIAALKNVLPKRTARKTARPMRMARLEPPLTPTRSPADGERVTTAVNSQPLTLNARKGFVLDYSILSGATNFTFAGDITYYCTNTVVLYGTTTLEGSATVKFSTNGAASITIYGTIDCETGPYRPAFFTAKDFNGVGETISGSTGSPSGYYGGVALDLTGVTNTPVLSNLRFSYLNAALAGTDITLRDTHVIQCKNGFAPNEEGVSRPTLRNVLIDRVHTFVVSEDFIGDSIIGENVTAHYCTNFLDDVMSDIRLTNCLFVCVTNWQAVNTYTNHSAFLDSDADVFQTVAGGSHYLAASSPYRNAGTTNINSDLLADLKRKTTYPPIAFTNTAITNISTLGLQAQRDTDVPDIGYHYDPLDWIFGGYDVNVDLTFHPGTAVGWFRYNQGWNHAGHGIHIADNKVLNFDGRVDSPCWFVHQTVAQEQRIGYAPADPGTGAITGWPVSAANSPTVKLRFTRCSGLPVWRNYFRDDYGVLRVNALDCEFYSGAVGGYVSINALTNCLFDRAGFWLDGGVLDQSITLRNCTWRGGGLSITRGSGSSHETPVSIRDCAFDASYVMTDDAHDGNSSITDYDFNAFLQGANRTTPQGANDVIVTNFNWQTSWLGSFYLPTNSPLLNTGSVTNAGLVGLYHYTTTTNQVKETTSYLDIGYHYVATDGSGNPLDTDGDGVPDYWEDQNGNGNGNDDPTSWQVYNSANGLGSGTGLQVFTPLK